MSILIVFLVSTIKLQYAFIAREYLVIIYNILANNSKTIFLYHNGNDK